MKSDILHKIRKHKPTALPLPELPEFPPLIDLRASFTKVLEQGGGKVIFIEKSTLPKTIDALFPDRKNTATTLSELPSDVDLDIQHPRELQDIDLCVLPAQLAVAENGALYLDERQMGHRVVPFITQHLVLVLNIRHVVGTMHEAYHKIELRDSGFGVFIAGPSKTADIEQSLVIGAQGARSLTVIILENQES